MLYRNSSGAAARPSCKVASPGVSTTALDSLAPFPGGYTLCRPVLPAGDLPRQPAATAGATRCSPAWSRLNYLTLLRRWASWLIEQHSATASIWGRGRAPEPHQKVFPGWAGMRRTRPVGDPGLATVPAVRQTSWPGYHNRPQQSTDRNWQVCSKYERATD